MDVPLVISVISHMRLDVSLFPCSPKISMQLPIILPILAPRPKRATFRELDVANWPEKSFEDTVNIDLAIYREIDRVARTTKLSKDKPNKMNVSWKDCATSDQDDSSSR
jgi:hypothetical protein